MSARVVHVRIPGRRPFRVVLGGRVAGVLTRLAGMPLLTLRATVYVRPGFTPLVTGIAHESEHVEQWADLGTLGFPARYLLEQLRRGYRRNRFEVRAREYATHHAHHFTHWETSCSG